MKFAAFVVLSCACICIAHSVSVTSWGSPTGRIIGYKNITMGTIHGRKSNVTFTYPPVNLISNFKFQKYQMSPKATIKSVCCCFFQGKSFQAIRGIKYLDYAWRPSAVKFLKGYVGARNVTIQVQAQPGYGINSTFIFYA